MTERKPDYVFNVVRWAGESWVQTSLRPEMTADEVAFENEIYPVATPRITHRIRVYLKKDSKK